jgi:hypothetical protein
MSDLQNRSAGYSRPKNYAQAFGYTKLCSPGVIPVKTPVTQFKYTTEKKAIFVKRELW